MKALCFIALLSVALMSCNKDKFTSVPQLKFNSIEPNVYVVNDPNNTVFTQGPMLSLQLTDAEGDFGFSDGTDTSYIYIKNITFPPFNLDSVRFPNGNGIKRKNLNAEVVVDLKKTAGGVLSGDPNNNQPHTDTLFFEVYVRDFANNKSEVIKTSEPLYFIRQ